MTLAIRIGFGLLLVALVLSCAGIPGLEEERAASYIKVPFVRVLLSDKLAEHHVLAHGSYAIECLSEGVQNVYYSSRASTVSLDGDYLSIASHNGNVIQARVDEINILPRGTGSVLSLGDKPYRGILKFLPSGKTIMVVNILYIEDYLRGVVPPEIGERTEDEVEAIKAQAVAARTYTMSHLQQYGGSPYDMKAGILDQVYEGRAVDNPLVNRAIDATAGQVLFFEDKYVNAYYHSTCGGMTDDIAAVWDRAQLAYLRPVADHGACSWSKYYRWQELFTEEQLRGRIEQYLASDRGRDLRIGRIKDITLTEHTPGGRVAKMVVTTDGDVLTFYKDRIRWVIGRTSNPDLILPSDRFTVDIERDAGGAVKYVTFHGSGYGHGVGMCQCGAIGMARQKQTYDQILKHYYSGVEIRVLY